ncbi:YbaN family protein [Clostridium sp. CS001]|uniref:YbaN family protein n=1 Tax=Clostridium sp. CS001 TaxID=2880648 RepID=UPI001CF342D6|nr:YbaN family protein [Clostridium sp. CS001]MCB2290793.1 YbaN family protein [Clostridium sp. CS001]
MRLKKLIYILVGVISFILGTIGIVLPILPTTPFYLLASFCFVRGSERFDKWFKGTKLYKNNLKSFIDNRSMPLRKKISVLVFADIMLLFPLIILDSKYVKIFIIILIAYKYYYFIYKIKTS